MYSKEYRQRYDYAHTSPRDRKAPSTPATMLKQQATMSKQRSTLLPVLATTSNEFFVKFHAVDKAETYRTRSVCSVFVKRMKLCWTSLTKAATWLPKKGTMSKERSTLSKESFDL